MTDHLDILDKKFGVLLQFQAILATAGSIIVTSVRNRNLYLSFEILLGLCCGLWLLDNLACLIGIRRIVWGEMGVFHSDPNDETVHVGALRTEVVKRTAKFRISMALMIFIVTLLPGLVIAAIKGYVSVWSGILLLLGLSIASSLVITQSRSKEITPTEPDPVDMARAAGA